MKRQDGIAADDLRLVREALSPGDLAALVGATVLVTGCAGSLGFCLTRFLALGKDELGLTRVIALDNFRAGRPVWLERLAVGGALEFHEFDVAAGDLSAVPGATDATLVLHMASIASPTFYRMHPLETLDANVAGLRRLLDFYRGKHLRGLAFFSSSEIYGEPVPWAIPTPESYRGNVPCQGPRACYDESKRLGETLCWIYGRRYGLPVSVIRPFNVYGPGMRLNDARVPADFARAVYEGQDIEILSDGTPTRTYCYVSDAVAGFMKALLQGTGGTYNIGADGPEMSVRELADVYAEAGREVFGYAGKVVSKAPDDPDYLADDPSRRCPDLTRAREALGYAPKIGVRDGVGRFLRYIKDTAKEDLIW